MELDDSDYVQRVILFDGGYELATLARYDALLREARGALDFGAHMGLYTLRAARALTPRGGRVFAVEPTPANSVALLRNAALSGLTNIELCTAAVSSAPALLRMIAPHIANTGGSRLASRAIAKDLRAIPLHVPVRPAAELVPVIPPECFDLVKIDVEGHEFHLLRSLLPAAPQLPGNILFEYKPTEFDYGPPDVTTLWLQSLGYELLTIAGVPFDSALPLPEDNLWARLRT
jgi:FkbM family methyltransferase